MKELNASEALFGFMGWLTARDASLTIGKEHDCSEIPKLIEEFAEKNQLTEPRDDWHKLLKHPQ